MPLPHISRNDTLKRCRSGIIFEFEVTISSQSLRIDGGDQHVDLTLVDTLLVFLAVKPDASDIVLLFQHVWATVFPQASSFLSRPLGNTLLSKIVVIIS